MRLVAIDGRIEAEIEAAEVADDASIPPGVLEGAEVLDTGSDPAAGSDPTHVQPQPDFDPEIAEIFSEEAAELLEAIDTEIGSRNGRSARSLEH